MSKKDPPGYPGDDAIKKAFGEAVRQIREERGLSLEEAEALVKQAKEKVDLSRAARALGIVVRRLREEQKLSRAQVSSALGLTLRLIINLERGKAQDASLTDIVRICYALNIAPADFVSQVEEATQKIGQSRFDLGRVLATPGALLALEKAGQQPHEFLDRHAHGDWGEVDSHDVKENECSLQRGLRLLSSYTTVAGDKLWIITEADRSATTLLLPEEY